MKVKIEGTERSQLIKSYIENALPNTIEEICDDESCRMKLFPELNSRKEKHLLTGMRKLSKTQPELTSQETIQIEAIINSDISPVIDIQGDSYEIQSGMWSFLGEEKYRKMLESIIPSVGRIEVPNISNMAFAGTGFIVGENLIMTNRHVAELFSYGLGIKGLNFIPGQVAGIDFKEEKNSEPNNEFYLDFLSVEMIHPYWDMALIKVAGIRGDRKPVRLSTEEIPNLINRNIAVIGYPGIDNRVPAEKLKKVFNGVFNIKRLLPGKITGTRTIRSYDNVVQSLAHNSTTMPGASGSILVDLTTGDAVGLHFAGRYLDSNFAVPTRQLASDSFVVDAGVNFDKEISKRNFWHPRWRAVDAEVSARSINSATPAKTTQQTSISQLGSRIVNNQIKLTIPLELSVGIPSGIFPTEMDSFGVDTTIIDKEGVKPNSNYVNRTGYDKNFLGEEVNIPWLTNVDYQKVARNKMAHDQRHVLTYDKFSIVMNAERRMPFFTCVNIDENKRITITNKEFNNDWVLDPRIDEKAQLDNEFYRKHEGIDNPYDRGHLVKRTDVCWGDVREEAVEAHHDTFHYTNAALQHFRFNRGGDWGDIEDFIGNNAGNGKLKISVMSGPVFKNDDPIYMTPTGFQVQVPIEFWKVVIYRRPDGKISSSSYLTSQSVQVSDTITETVFGDFRNFQISLQELESVTNLQFQDLRETDSFVQSDNESSVQGRNPITNISQIIF
ncbi:MULTISPECIES: DNA/RNA non-specific endonuclease [Flavobacteriaceae]|uniref:DNA/RNA non-specific endonuclease n=1 Tax=Flavobacteriaceae TaxID=49546 RepID=UPI001492F4C4|nr:MULTISPECIES: DNA/RNA non-specific endonuclease [Allomuricauda]MDC6366654.1 DNA/RNA non-specific endonuclease [Muricauda sp. AC10]